MISDINDMELQQSPGFSQAKTQFIQHIGSVSRSDFDKRIQQRKAHDHVFSNFVKQSIDISILSVITLIYNVNEIPTSELVECVNDETFQKYLVDEGIIISEAMFLVVWLDVITQLNIDLENPLNLDILEKSIMSINPYDMLKELVTIKAQYVNFVDLRLKLINMQSGFNLSTNISRLNKIYKMIKIFLRKNDLYSETKRAYLFFERFSNAENCLITPLNVIDVSDKNNKEIRSLMKELKVKKLYSNPKHHNLLVGSADKYLRRYYLKLSGIKIIDNDEKIRFEIDMKDHEFIIDTGATDNFISMNGIPKDISDEINISEKRYAISNSIKTCRRFWCLFEVDKELIDSSVVVGHKHDLIGFTLIYPTELKMKGSLVVLN